MDLKACNFSRTMTEASSKAVSKPPGNRKAPLSYRAAVLQDAHVFQSKDIESICEISSVFQFFHPHCKTPTCLLSFLAQLPFRHQPHLGHHCKDSYRRSLHQRDMLNVARPKLAPPPKVVLPAWKKQGTQKGGTHWLNQNSWLTWNQFTGRWHKKQFLGRDTILQQNTKVAFKVPVSSKLDYCIPLRKNQRAK